MSYGTSYDHMMRTSSFSLNNMVLHPLYPNEDCVGTDLTWHEDPRTLLQGGQRQIFTGSSWQQQSNFPQHFDDENKQSAMYSPGLSLALHSSSRPGMDAVSSVPQVAGPRMVSPVPSYDISTPTSSNARSPATDSEYPESYGTPQIHDDLLFPNDISYSNTDFGSACAGRPPLPLFAQPAGYPCVNLSDVQAWSDPQDLLDPPEDVFMSPKGYLDMGQTEYSIEVDTQTSKGADARAAYRPSPATHPQLRTPNNVGYAQAEDQFEAATDVDADIEEEDEIIEEEASDTDYKPKATRATKRRRNNSFKPSSSSTRGRGRVTKPKRARATKATKMQETVQCKTCKALFDNSDLLERHVEDSHPRSFTCVFNFAGCDSTFGSKNEWKRHVSTQHLVFNTWTCNIDQCEKAHDPTPSAEKNASGGQASKGGSFNRKDLFTQHLRRMHSPAISKKQTNQKAKWEEKVKALQQSCMRLNRSPPKALNCPVADCEAVFGGPKCWDDHMEHVAKHLENAANITGAPSVHHEDDQSLVSWALTEGVIELVSGVFKLIPTETYFERLEQDAEGESEY